VSYPAILAALREHGERLTSRLGDIREAPGARLLLVDPLNCVVDRDGFSERFMREEIRQLLAGVHDNDRLRAVTPLAADLITPLTAYGPRTHTQLRNVEQELMDSPDSRRAVVYVGRDHDLVSVGERTAGEMPCTCLWQFVIRHGRLNMFVYMRSCDVTWGLPYDVPSFVSVQAMLAISLGVPLGGYVHNAGSLHLYEKHLDVQARAEGDSFLDLSEELGSSVSETQDRCRRLVGWVG